MIDNQRDTQGQRQRTPNNRWWSDCHEIIELLGDWNKQQHKVAVSFSQLGGNNLRCLRKTRGKLTSRGRYCKQGQL